MYVIDWLMNLKTIHSITYPSHNTNITIFNAVDNLLGSDSIKHLL